MRLMLTKAVIGPHDEITVGGIGLGLQMLQENIANNITFFFDGSFHYDDIFQKHHVTKFCYQIVLNPESDGIIKPYNMMPRWPQRQSSLQYRLRNQTNRPTTALACRASLRTRDALLSSSA
jgi:hypothetical protein